MNNFQTMPLRFRVWDGEKFVKDQATGSTEMGLVELFNNLGQVMYLCNEWAISQDTGFKDKDGNSIFTGDIIKRGGDDEFATTEYVVWSPKYGGVESLQSPDDKFPTSLDQDDSSYVEVVGHIWENPELLESD